ncbi:MAG: hypothetical protein FJX80_01405 [Bacteroidetes bacterium]|nr:hypothetical protein [Bacteroidota bacterium]
MIKSIFLKSISLTWFIAIIISCKEDFSIKPPAKLRLDFPKQEYVDWQSLARFTSKRCEHYLVSCQFDRNKLIEIGDVVAVQENILKKINGTIERKILSTGIPLAGIVRKFVKGGKIMVEIDLGEEELEIMGRKKSKFNLLLNRDEVQKISQYEPFDLVEKISMENIHADFMLHYKSLSPKDTLGKLIRGVVNNVESHKFKSESIEKIPIQKKDKSVYGMLYEFTGDMATPFQFYLTDSLGNFVYAQVLMDFQAFQKDKIPTDLYTKSRIMDYLKNDLLVFIDHFNWEK